jgi:predicted glutamine amidotransferase
MCRLFGLSSAPHRTSATFWLLDDSDSLLRQSRANPDGTGLGTFDTHDRPVIEKQPLAATDDPQFATEARHRRSTTFLAHVRHASTGSLNLRNTHPFTQRGRIFAHNGVIEDLPRLEQELGNDRDLVAGDTDSERFFALITRHIDAQDGDVGAGITQAVRWVARTLPIFSINFILTTPTDLWALRYPDAHDLLVLDRRTGQADGTLRHAGTDNTVRVTSTELADLPAVVVASEPMDDDPGWKSLASGELLHVDGTLNMTRSLVVDEAPAHPLSLSDLGAAAASQVRR